MRGLPHDPREAQKILRELLDYDPATRVLTWRVRDRKWFEREQDQKTWNVRFANTMAFTTPHPKGYLRGQLLGRFYFAHQIIWALVKGEWPDQIDHEDGVRANNRWSNLRDVTTQQNQQNRKRPKTNTSGYMGVSFHKSTQKYRAGIWLNGKKIHLGLFTDPKDASEAYKAKAMELGFHANHGRAA